MPLEGKLQSIVTLIQMARDGPAQSLPNETYQSYPIPLVHKQELKVLFLYCPCRAVPGKGRLYLPPSYQAVLDALTGHLEELNAVHPRDFGLSDEPGEFLHSDQPPSALPPKEFEAQRNQLFQAYDALLPVYTSGSRPVEKVGVGFVRLFLHTIEPPLAAYYRAAGKDFFAWLNRYIGNRNLNLEMKT